MKQIDIDVQKGLLKVQTQIFLGVRITEDAKVEILEKFKETQLSKEDGIDAIEQGLDLLMKELREEFLRRL